ncbi:hypothetical protein LCGC14_2840170 [marine sediment metagenome]|uniref:Uncharacterized protein n=1 Tax=marine sediment metagenome TaxID=412755 RepID=A0A0F8YBL2_9ZZZZ
MSVQEISQEGIYTEENSEILAIAVVEGWDQKALIQYAISQLTQAYQVDKECFMQDWNAYIKYYV